MTFHWRLGKPEGPGKCSTYTESPNMPVQTTISGKLPITVDEEMKTFILKTNLSNFSLPIQLNSRDKKETVNLMR